MQCERTLDRHADFLKSLCSEPSRKVRRLLANATLPELNVLIKILHCVSRGRIPIDRKDYLEVIRKKKLPFLRQHFEGKESVRLLVRAPRCDKLDVLFKLLSVIPLALKQMLS